MIVFITGGESILTSWMAPVENPTKMDDWPEGLIDRDGLDGIPPGAPGVAAIYP